METFPANEEGYYGQFGGAYVPEILHASVEALRPPMIPPAAAS